MNGKTIYSVYTQKMGLVSEYNRTTEMHIDYIRAGGSLIAKVESKGSLSDPDNGSFSQFLAPENDVESDGILWTDQSLPFGLSLFKPSAKKSSIGFTGHVEDSSELVYMQARYYDPVIGRFLSNDPVGALRHLNTPNGIHGFNRYAYGNNNPYRYKDPTGKSSEEANMWANMFGFSSAGQATTKINGALESGRQAVVDATPSRETVHAVANGASLTLAVAAVTTPCIALCAGGSLVVDTAVAADHLSQGDIKNAALTMLPGATGEAVSVAHKTTKTAVNLAESAKRGAAASVLTNQAVGDTQKYQNKKEEEESN